MVKSLRSEAEGYLKAARGGVSRPEKFTVEALFQLTALAVEGFLLAWLEDRKLVVSHHGFRDLVKAVETCGPLSPDLRRGILELDQYQKLCDWIPLEPRKATQDDLPRLLVMAEAVGAWTKTPERVIESVGGTK